MFMCLSKLDFHAWKDGRGNKHNIKIRPDHVQDGTQQGSSTQQHAKNPNFKHRELNRLKRETCYILQGKNIDYWGTSHFNCDRNKHWWRKRREKWEVAGLILMSEWVSLLSSATAEKAEAAQSSSGPRKSCGPGNWSSVCWPLILLLRSVSTKGHFYGSTLMKYYFNDFMSHCIMLSIYLIVPQDITESYFLYYISDCPSILQTGKQLQMQ